MKSGKGSKLLGSLVKILQHNKEWMKSMHKLSGLFSIIPRIFVLSYDYKETNTVFLIADTSSSYNYLLLTSLSLAIIRDIDKAWSVLG